MATSTDAIDARAATDRSMPPHRITSIAPAARIMSGTAESSAVHRLAGRRKFGLAIAIAVTSAASTTIGMIVSSS